MRAAAPVLAALAISAAAAADPVRFDWTGTVSFADPSLASAGIVVGAPAVGHYRFESATADGNPDPQIGFYDLALLEWRVAVGLVDNTTQLPGFGDIQVRLDFEGQGDLYQVDAGPAVLLRLQDTDGSALLDDGLPVTPPDLAEYEVAALAQLDPLTGDPLAVIDLATLSLSPPRIPALPGWGGAAGALLVVLTGLRGLGWPSVPPGSRSSPRPARCASTSSTPRTSTPPAFP